MIALQKLSMIKEAPALIRAFAQVLVVLGTT